MTIKRAEAILANIMKKKTPLTVDDRALLREVSNVIRNMNKKRNPASAHAVKIYGRVLRVEAQKTQAHRCDEGCRKAKHCYYHDFKNSSNAVLYGLSDGSFLVKGTKRLWGMF
jgi:hypothetical protein